MQLRKRALFFLTVALAIKLISHISYAWLGIEGVYYIGEAIAWPIVIGSLISYVKNKVLYVIFEVMFWLSINNLIDEIFFNPGKLEWNEFVFAGVAIFIGLYRYFKIKLNK